MKIVFITTGNIKYIATSKRALGMANHLADLGWSVHILMEDVPENRTRFELECDARIKIHYFPNSDPFTELRNKNKIVNNIKPDFVYICAFVFRNIVKTKKSVKKLVEHSELSSSIKTGCLSKRILSLILEFYSIYYADGLLLASRFLEKIYDNRKNFFLKKCLPFLYFPYAYNSQLYKPNQLLEDDELRERYRNKKVFLFLGSLTENYGLFTMLQAFALLKTQRPEVVLLLLGKCLEYEKTVKFIEDNKIDSVVKILGYVPEEDVKKYFDIATAFISPMNDTIQDWARCPSKIYMYLPYGKPIITCKIGDPFEVLGNDGVYYTTGDFKSLAEACKLIISKNIRTISIDSSRHSWKSRTTEFDKWLLTNFT